MTAAASVEWTVVSTEVEALQLEYNWIKEFDPRFNVRYRDDKSYPVLAVTLNEEFPRLFVYRGAAAQGRALLRSVLPRLGDPRDPRPAAAGFPGAHLLERGVQAAQPDRAAMPARLHRQVLGAVRRAGQCRGAPPHRRRLLRLPRRAHRPARARAGEADARGIGGAGLRDRGAAARRRRRVAAGVGEAGRRPRQRHRRRRRRVRHRRTRGGRAGFPRPRWPGAGSARLGGGEDRRGIEDSDPDAGLPILVEQFLTQFYGEQATQADIEAATSRPAIARCRARFSSPCCRRTPSRCRTGSAAARRVGAAAGAAARGQEGPRRDRAAQREGGARAAQTQARRRLRLPFGGAAGHPGGARPGLARRCGSSASTSATCRAPTSSRRWSCSRTGCRASPTTGTTRSRRPPARAAPTTSRASRR